MELLKPKAWAVADLACLKWSAILFGMIAGAYLSEFVLRNVRFFVIGCIVLAIKPAVAFFRHR